MKAIGVQQGLIPRLNQIYCVRQARMFAGHRHQNGVYSHGGSNDLLPDHSVSIPVSWRAIPVYWRGRLSQSGEGLGGLDTLCYDESERLQRSRDNPQLGVATYCVCSHGGHGGLDTLCRWFADVGLHLLTVVMAGKNDPYLGRAARHYACSHGGETYRDECGKERAVAFLKNINMYNLNLGYRPRSLSKGCDKNPGDNYCDWLHYFIRIMVISIVKGYNQSEKLRRSEITHSLAWQRIAFAAMAGVSSVFGCLPN
nr:hypothetical protein [Tanacetum cinerariifolium]